jgi:hypothetical protein
MNVGLRPELELVIKANNVEIHNQNDIRTNVTKAEVNNLQTTLFSEVFSHKLDFL